jgi:hypothetical protein
MALPGVPAQAGQTRPSQARPGLWLVASSPGIVQAGTPTWVSLHWTSWTDLCEVRVTVAGRGVDVHYPTNTGSYTSFYRTSGLAAGRTDFMAFRVTTDAMGAVPLRVRVSFVPGCRGHVRHTTTEVVTLAVFGFGSR